MCEKWPAYWRGLLDFAENTFHALGVNKGIREGRVCSTPQPPATASRHYYGALS
jgi:hypothetical protein